MRRSDLFLKSFVMLFVVLAFALLVCDVLMAQEVVKAAEVAAPAAPAAPAVTPVVEPIPWWVNLLWQVVLPGLASVIAFIWGIAKVKFHLDEGNKKEAASIAEIAVKATYDEFVRDAKASHQDGKLTKDEIAHAGKMAFGKAVEIGKAKGFDFAKIVSAEAFGVVADKVIKALKKS